MTLITFFPKLSEKQIRNDTKNTIKEIKKWFDKNPERKTCLVQLWYSNRKRVSRTNFEKMINVVANKYIEEDKKEK